MRILDHAREKHADRDVHVQVLDINKEMLAEGQKRFARTMYHGGASLYLSSDSSLKVLEVQAHKYLSRTEMQKTFRLFLPRP